MTESQLRPKLVVDSADEAIAFYIKAFGAVAGDRYDVGGRVVFAAVTVFGQTLTLKDEDDADRSPTTLGGSGVLLDVVTDDPDGLAEAAVAAGATVRFPVADQPYGARGGRVRDPFGHEWLLQTPVTMTPGQVRDALDG